MLKIGYPFFGIHVNVASSRVIFPTTAGALGVVQPGHVAGRALTEDTVTVMCDGAYALVFASTTPVGVIDWADQPDLLPVDEDSIRGKERQLLLAAAQNPLDLD